MDRIRQDLAGVEAAGDPLERAIRLAGLVSRVFREAGWELVVVGGLFVDHFGHLENEAVAPCRTIDSPCGTVTILPTGMAVVERVLLAFYPQPSGEARTVAKKLLAVCVRGATPVDWAEIDRLASQMPR